MKKTLVASVAVAKATRGYDREYSYLVPDALAPCAEAGRLARVPFGPKDAERYAIILSVQTSDDESDAAPLKPLIAIPGDIPLLLPGDIDLADKIRKKYDCTWFDALSCMLPAGWRRKKGISLPAKKAEPDDKVVNTPRLTLTPEQDEAAAHPHTDTDVSNGTVVHTPRLILTPEQDEALESISRRLGSFSEALLYGITGSGKTEVYMRLIERVLSTGRQAIALVPEISLTPQMMGRFTEYFGGRVAIFHSKLTEAERRNQWLRVKGGEAPIALGARSAVFAPFDNIGVIIIDEEHEPSYKSEMTPRYHTSDIAKMRCEAHGALLLYGSATPSVELFHRASGGGCGLYTLKERTNRQPMPKVYIADMRDEIKNGNRGMFSRMLTKSIHSALADKKQAILFLNRRGYSSFLLCRTCGYIVSCRNCSVSFTYHRANDRLVCHYCGLDAPSPKRCPVCGGAEISGFGAGTERIEREVQKMFPKSRILRMDRDTTAGKDAYVNILDAFKNGGADILIGTQMIAKGHDFPGVTLVGALAADSILNFSDFRATERTFQLLTQVAGRSGRGDAPGTVVIQTYNPDHYSVAYAKGHDYRGFYKQEMAARRALRYPPFMNIGIFLMTGLVDDIVGGSAERLYKSIEGGAPDGLALLPPNRPPHARIKERYRWRIVVKHEEISTLEEVARRASRYFYGHIKAPGVDLLFDINPYSMI